LAVRTDRHSAARAQSIRPDVDHLLRPRADGNEHLHRFLTIADGVAHTNGRKVIFSSNLPNIGAQDDALIRPGRCFAQTQMRELTSVDAEQLLRQLIANDPHATDVAARALSAAGRRTLSLAEVYQAVHDARQRLRPVGVAA
jgi:ATP-dependent Zn protease